jgi:hypothetical protein
MAIVLEQQASVVRNYMSVVDQMLLVLERLGLRFAADGDWLHLSTTIQRIATHIELSCLAELFGKVSLTLSIFHAWRIMIHGPCGLADPVSGHQLI